MRFRQQFDKPQKRGKHGRFLWFLVPALIYGRAAFSDAMTISPGDLGDWRERSFLGRTRYEARDGALRAVAEGSASALCQTVPIDLKNQPIARWTWRLEIVPERTKERAQAGDDQGLRLTFLHRPAETMGEASETMESTIAIQYVWSQNEPVDAQIEAMGPNAFVADAYQIVARSGPAQPGRWQSEQRDLRADFQRAFGRAIDRVDAICLMTDGDQTGALVEGWYGDITVQAR
jgi:hypothetical protein